MTIVLPKQWVLRKGTFDADTGRFTVEAKHINDVAWCINKRLKLGVPVVLKYTHSQDEQAIGVGLMENAIIEHGQVYADLKITQPATKDFGDGRGKVLLATVEEIANSLTDRTMQLSLEGSYDVSSPSFYGDRTLSLEITAWAVLPAGTLPAVPQIAAKGEKGNRVTMIIAEAEKEGATTTSEKEGEAVASPEEVEKEKEEKTEELSVEDQLANLLKRMKELEVIVEKLEEAKPKEETKEETPAPEKEEPASEETEEEEETKARRILASNYESTMKTREARMLVAEYEDAGHTEQDLVDALYYLDDVSQERWTIIIELEAFLGEGLYDRTVAFWETNSTYAKRGRKIRAEGTFYRLPKDIIGNDLYSVNKKLNYFYGSVHNGNDVDPGLLDTIIRMLNKVKESIKEFSSADDVEGTVYAKRGRKIRAKEVDVDEGDTIQMSPTGMEEEVLKKAGISLDDYKQFIKEAKQFSNGGKSDMVPIAMDTFGWSKAQAEEVWELYVLTHWDNVSQAFANRGRNMTYGDRKHLSRISDPVIARKVSEEMSKMPSLRARKPLLSSQTVSANAGKMEKEVSQICAERGLSRANAFDVWCKENPKEARQWIK